MANPAAVAAKMPEFKAATAKAAPAKPAKTGACEVKYVVKGYYCLMCKRELTPDDVRNSACKRCETKPAELEYCAARIPYFKSICQHMKKADAPFVCCGKPSIIAFNEDRARLSYECESCGVKGELASEIKHKEGCAPKFGGGLKKICSKSGKEPHASDAK